MQNSIARQGEVVDTLAIRQGFSDAKHSLLVKSERVKVMRLMLAAGKSLPEHKAPGEITVHCLAGEIRFTTMGTTQQLVGGNLIYLPTGELHSVDAVEDSIILVTIVA